MINTNAEAKILCRDMIEAERNLEQLRARAWIGMRGLRERSGKTLREVAEGAGISPTYLSDLERGNREFSAPLLALVVNSICEGRRG